MHLPFRVSGWVLATILMAPTVAAASGNLKVTSFPSGAQVWIDGVNSGKTTPMSITLAEGDHVVTVQLPNSGWNADTRTVSIVAGNNDLSVTLLPLVTQGLPGPQGPPGPQGVQGEPGIPGAPGVGVTVFSESPGVNCVNGGVLITSVNGNHYVCNGSATGTPDPPCYGLYFGGPSRHVDCGNGTVTDTVTGLLWLKDADCVVFNEHESWLGAQTLVGNLGHGQCGLTDGSSPGDWRLPTRVEWQETIAPALSIDVCGRSPFITDGWGTNCLGVGPSPLLGVVPVKYWSGSAYGPNPFFAWAVDLREGSGLIMERTDVAKVWPVRRR